MAKSLILDIKLKYLDLLLSGRKSVELRRSHPAAGGTAPGQILYLARLGAIRGQVTIDAINFEGIHTLDSPMAFAIAYADRACLTTQEAIDYMDGARSPAAYTVSHPISYRHPVPCQQKIPNSWCYISPALQRLCQIQAAIAQR